ncbi:uncharacterized protein LAJ45_05257 [Morchella importuna]|uniref:uncharacterized protein n=1 Tax=Morchella importuna TaxID=1174673 RepID=UPI001E8DE3E2|nr:uncharacterized protein LAJ45_05257 [Morchella importuna]KAH8150561.1 hypothetical protein LAJ45_05257 [Morchella importuna]
MATTQPLAIQCRDPGEFISSIIEHHRAGGGGVQQPLKDEEKTYLIFVGIDDENGVFEMMDDDDREYLPLSGEEEPEMPWSESDGSEQRLPGEPPGSGQHQMTQSQTPELGKAEDVVQGHEGHQAEDLNHGATGLDQGFQSANGQKSPISKITEAKTPEHSSPPALPEAEETVSPVQLPIALPSSSPLSSPPPEEDDEELFMTGESAVASKGQDGSQSPISKSPRDLDNHLAGGKELHKETGARSEATKGNEVKSRATEANISIPETPNTRRKVLLQIREPSSPIPPQPHEISPLTAPGDKPPVSQSYQSSPAVPRSSMITSPTAKRFPIPTKVSNTAQSQQSEEEEEEYTTYPTPTLDILSAAEHIELLYLRDLKTLRTFLTLLQYTPPAPSSPDTDSNPPLLAIWGLIGAHHHTTGEFSGEGIANTLSLAVDAAAESGRFLVLGEGYVQEDIEGGEVSWMEAEVPVLRGGGGGVGRTVVVKGVLGRWCRFVEELE